MTDAPESTVHAGDILAGKYRVERVLGSGGMGVVVAAHHIQLDEKVALKFLHAHALDAESRARFVREARAAVKIKNEHVARVTDVGQLENGAPYMVMEYLEGGDLSAWLRERGPLPVEQAVDFLLQTCEAIADAHVLGIVHRDLKPANLFCTQRSDGELSIKVLDFGISKVLTPGAAGHDMTGTQVLMGSPHYMSPEQMQKSKGVDTRTDIWALGVILYELLTGKPPFDAEAVTELAIMVANDPTPPLRAGRPEAPAALEQVIGTCMAKDRASRFQTVGELAVALKDHGSKASRLSVERVLGTLRKAGLSQVVLPPTPAGDFHSSPPSAAVVFPVDVPQTAATWQTVADPKKSRRALLGLGVVVGLVVLVVAGVLVLRGPAAAPAPASITAAAATASSPSAAASQTTLSPAPYPSAVPYPSAAPSAPPSSAPPASAAPPAVAKPASPHPAAPAAVTPRAAPKPPAPNCNPPYYFDSSGFRRYKPECL